MGLFFIIIIFASVIAFDYYISLLGSKINDDIQLKISFYSAVVAASIGAAATIFTTHLIIQRSYKVDFHQERMRALPVISIETVQPHVNYDKPSGIFQQVKNEPDFIENDIPDDGTLFRITNCGSGLAINVEIVRGIVRDEDVDLGSIRAGENKYIVVWPQNQYSIKFEFSDVYGNKYFQYCNGSRWNENKKIGFICSPPVLVRRTKRIRYFQ